MIPHSLRDEPKRVWPPPYNSAARPPQMKSAGRGEGDAFHVDDFQPRSREEPAHYEKVDF